MKAGKKTSKTFYVGVERRRHRTYVTRNTEYHFRDSVCVAVRDRASREWLADHVALKRSVSGSIKFLPGGAVRPTLGQPVLGESLFFASGGRDLVTSPLIEVTRPEMSVVECFPKPKALPKPGPRSRTR